QQIVDQRGLDKADVVAGLQRRGRSKFAKLDAKCLVRSGAEPGVHQPDAAGVGVSAAQFRGEAEVINARKRSLEGRAQAAQNEFVLARWRAVVKEQTIVKLHNPAEAEG